MVQKMGKDKGVHIRQCFAFVSVIFIRRDRSAFANPISQAFTLYHFLLNLESVDVRCIDLTKFLMICRAKKSSK